LAASSRGRVAAPSVRGWHRVPGLIGFAWRQFVATMPKAGITGGNRPGHDDRETTLLRPPPYPDSYGFPPGTQVAKQADTPFAGLSRFSRSRIDRHVMSPRSTVLLASCSRSLQPSGCMPLTALPVGASCHARAVSVAVRVCSRQRLQPLVLASIFTHSRVRTRTGSALAYRSGERHPGINSAAACRTTKP
jgi:hypothetical protein